MYGNTFLHIYKMHSHRCRWYQINVIYVSDWKFIRGKKNNDWELKIFSTFFFFQWFKASGLSVCLGSMLRAQCWRFGFDTMLFFFNAFVGIECEVEGMVEDGGRMGDPHASQRSKCMLRHSKPKKNKNLNVCVRISEVFSIMKRERKNVGYFKFSQKTFPRLKIDYFYICM